MTHPNNHVPCTECEREFCCLMHMGRHRVTAHQGIVIGPHINRVTSEKRKHNADTMDALISVFRRQLEEARTMGDLLTKMQTQLGEQGAALEESQREVKRLDRENAELRGKLLSTRQQRNDARKQVTVTPLEERLTEEELRYLMQVREGKA